MKKAFFVFIILVLAVFFISSCTYDRIIVPQPKKAEVIYEQQMPDSPQSQDQINFKKYYEDERQDRSDENDDDNSEDSNNDDGVDDIFADTDVNPPTMPS